MAFVDSGYVRSGAASLYYEIYGAGSPLILLHGNGENMKYFRNNAGFLSSYFKVILIDTRGHGKSTHSGEKLNFCMLADDVFNVMDKLRIEKPSVLGFSDGGNTALHMAILNGELIDKMAICGANLNFGGLTATTQAAVRAMYITAAIKDKFSGAKNRNAHIIELMLHYPRLTEANLGYITVETLVIAGEKDMICESHTRLIASAIHGSKLKIIKNGSHFILRDNADECNEVLLEFFGNKLAY